MVGLGLYSLGVVCFGAWCLVVCLLVVFWLDLMDLLFSGSVGVFAGRLLVVVCVAICVLGLGLLF